MNNVFQHRGMNENKMIFAADTGVVCAEVKGQSHQVLITVVQEESNRMRAAELGGSFHK